MTGLGERFIDIEQKDRLLDRAVPQWGIDRSSGSHIGCIRVCSANFDLDDGSDPIDQIYVLREQGGRCSRGLTSEGGPVSIFGGAAGRDVWHLVDRSFAWGRAG